MIQADLGTLTDTDRVKHIVHTLDDQGLLRHFSIDDTGIFAYIISDDFLGGSCLAEIVSYIKPENRGSIKLVLRYLQKVEDIAKENHCSSEKIGGNIGYKDQSFLKLLRRLGYVDDTLAKHI